ncbi:MAG: nucleotidyltransferase family protein [Reichenbachiella sp.]
METKIATIVLAAGKGSRMGEVKQLLPVDDHTLIEGVLKAALASKSNTIICVLGAHAEKIAPYISPLDIEIIENENWQNGMSTSISCGIDYLEQKHPDLKYAMILLADQPTVNTAMIDDLIDLQEKNPNRIVASDYLGKPGVPAIFLMSYWSSLKELTGDQGARRILSNDKNVIMCKQQEDLIDIDTPENYQQFIKDQSE